MLCYVSVLNSLKKVANSDQIKIATQPDRQKNKTQQIELIVTYYKRTIASERNDKPNQLRKGNDNPLITTHII